VNGHMGASLCCNTCAGGGELTNGAHDTGVMSEGEREIACRKLGSNRARGTSDVQNLPSAKLVLVPLR